MRKVLGVFLVFMFALVPCAGAAHGSSGGPSEDMLDAYLCSAGYPDYVIDRLDRDLKLQLYDEKCVFVRFEEGNPFFTNGDDRGEPITVPLGISNYHE